MSDAPRTALEAAISDGLQEVQLCIEAGESVHDAVRSGYEQTIRRLAVQAELDTLDTILRYWDTAVRALETRHRNNS